MAIRAGRLSAFSVRRRLHRAIARDARSVIGVGFSLAAYLPMGSCLAWCVNGIPEERLLHGRTLIQRLAVRLAWRAAKRMQKALSIVVSEPMAQLVRNRSGCASFVVPNTVDRSIFHPEPNIASKFLTYVGGGSPWQGLDRLALIWHALHDLDPSLRFRVVTQDPRAHVLAEGLPTSIVEVRATKDPHQVAAYLREARLGFLVREPNLVNEVSWPMKLGEYLGAGAPVVITRCGWDAERLVERHRCGLVIEWEDKPQATAQRIHNYLVELKAGSPVGLETASAELDASRWKLLLRDKLVQLAGASRNDVVHA